MKAYKEEILIKLGSKLKDFRTKKSFSQLELSIESNISLAMVSGIEQGKYNPSILTLIKIAKALDIQVKDLIEF